MDKTVEISIKHIFKELCLNLALSLVWGRDAKLLSKTAVEAQRNAFKMKAHGIVSLFEGTRLMAIGTPQYMFCEIYLPSDWIDYIKENDCWPKWFDKSKITDSRFLKTPEKEIA